jgi:SAM-dependent methyltransferase
MSQFSSVDSSPDPGQLVHYLETAATAESGMKQYAAAAHALRRPSQLVLDLGCGAGHDLALLDHARVAAVGVDASRVMLAAATRRLSNGGPARASRG